MLFLAVMQQFGKHGETVVEPAELGGELRVDDKAEAARQLVDRVIDFFSAPKEILLSSESPRVNDIREFTMTLLTDHVGLSPVEVAEKFQCSPEAVELAPIGAWRNQSEQWEGYRQALLQEKPPIPLLDQYLAGFCLAYKLRPDMLTEPKNKGFLSEPRAGLIYRLITETPIPREQLCKKFNIANVNALTTKKNRMARRMQANPEMRRRVLSVPLADTLPPPSPDPEDIMESALKASGVSREELADPSNQRLHVKLVRHYIIRRQYHETPLQANDIAPTFGVSSDTIEAIALHTEPPEQLEEQWLSPRKRFHRESEALSGWFGFPIQKYKGSSWPHRILLSALSAQDVNKSDIAEVLNMNKAHIFTILRQFEERVQSDPEFSRFVEAATERQPLPGGQSFVDTVLTVSALAGGTNVNGLRHQHRTTERDARMWASYFLRRVAGLRRDDVQAIIHANISEIPSQDTRVITERIASSPEEAAKEAFLLHAILGDWPTPNVTDAVLYFRETAAGTRQAVAGQVSGEYQDEGRRLWVIPTNAPAEEYSVAEHDPGLIDGESARVITQDPKLLDVWLYAKEVPPKTAVQIKKVLAELS